jgi:hypothetical protein
MAWSVQISSRVRYEIWAVVETSPDSSQEPAVAPSSEQDKELQQYDLNRLYPLITRQDPTENSSGQVFPSSAEQPELALPQEGDLPSRASQNATLQGTQPSIPGDRQPPAPSQRAQKQSPCVIL